MYVPPLLITMPAAPHCNVLKKLFPLLVMPRLPSTTIFASAAHFFFLRTFKYLLSMPVYGHSKAFLLLRLGYVRRRAQFNRSKVCETMLDTYSQILVNRVLALCKQREMSVYQLSIMSGVSHSTLDNFVNRKTFNPKIKTLHKIATAFSMTVAEFLDFPELNNYSFADEPENGEH